MDRAIKNSYKRILETILYTNMIAKICLSNPPDSRYVWLFSDFKIYSLNSDNTLGFCPAGRAPGAVYRFSRILSQRISKPL